MVASNHRAPMPYFRGIPRQRGRGFGALASVIGRTAVPFLSKYVAPIAKSLGQNILQAAVPEALSVIDGNTSVRQALRNTGRHAAKRQLGGGGSRKRSVKRKTTTASGVKKRKRRVAASKGAASRKRKVARKTKRYSQFSRKDFFSNLN